MSILSRRDLRVTIRFFPYCILPLCFFPIRSEASPQLIEALVNMRFQVSPQLFAVMAAVQAASPDSESPSPAADPVHKMVRNRIAALNPDLRKRIREFCAARDQELSVSRLQSKYVSLGLVLGGPPGFSIALKPAELPPDVKALAGFETLVSELWRAADLGSLWEEARPLYVKEIELYRPMIREMIVSTLRYLRTEARVSLDRQVTFIPELQISSGAVNARNIGHDYIVVVGASRAEERPLRSIRHEYLHFLLDPFLAKYVGYLPEEAPFAARVKEQPAALPRYVQSFYLMVTESLLEMVEMFLDEVSPERRPAVIVEAWDRGLILAPYFAEFLTTFGARTESLPVLFQGLIEEIRWNTESTRNEEISRIRKGFAEGKAKEAERVKSQAEIRELLSTANRLLLSREFDQAGDALEKVLRLDPDNASALFGTAQVYSQRQALEQALEYYEKAALSAGRDRWIAGWSYLHRGNIFRSQDEMEKARAEWSRVLNLDGDLRGAMEAARKALAQSAP